MVYAVPSPPSYPPTRGESLFSLYYEKHRMTYRTKLSLVGIGLATLGFYFLSFLVFVFTPQALAAPEKSKEKTGFLVVAQDRGFLGNQEIEAVMDGFKKTYPAALALLGTDQPGVAKTYGDGIRRAVAALEERGIRDIVAVPLFVSGADAVWNRHRDTLAAFVSQTTLRFAPPMAESYLTAQILLDRVESLSKDPGEERLVVLGTGAPDEAGAQRIEDDLKQLLKEVTARHAFRETVVEVYYDRAAVDAEKKNEAAEARIIRLAAKPGRTLLVPFAIGPKFDGHMSVEGWLARTFGEYDIARGETLLPHPDVLTWLKATANRYVAVARDDIGVVIMPHGSSQPYNAGLEKMIAPLKKRYRIEMAYGMADPTTIAQAVRRLEAEGKKRIVFVRLYALKGHMKAESDYLLGLSDEAPHGEHGDGAPPPRIRSSAVFETTGGYEEDPFIAGILRERILEISKEPDREMVILLAHGSMGEQENARWEEVMNANIARIKQGLPKPFRAIQAMTLREDWPDKREQALAQIKAAIAKGNEDGGRVLIVSNRLYGSGPYQRLLAGAKFEMNDRGLTPHSNMTRWLEREIEQAMQRLQLFMPQALSTEEKHVHSHSTGGTHHD